MFIATAKIKQWVSVCLVPRDTGFLLGKASNDCFSKINFEDQWNCKMTMVGLEKTRM